MEKPECHVKCCFMASIILSDQYQSSDQGEYLSAHLKMTDSVHYSIQPKINDLLQDYTIR